MRKHLSYLLTLPLFVAGLGLFPHPSARADDRPNLLLIVTDDMSASDLRWMPRTRRVLERRGVKLTDFISNHPLCCPARAEILTGQYAQNNGVHHNKGFWGGFPAHDPKHTIATWLQDAGYQTAFVGKYLNDYHGSDGAVPGWTDFNPTTEMQYSPFGFSALYASGGQPGTTATAQERRVHDVYTGDWVRRQTIRYIKEYHAADKPFFIYASQLAPHGMFVRGRWVPPVPAPRHRRLFPHALPPSLESPAFDSKAYRSNRVGVTRSHVVRYHRARIRALQAVDQANAAAVRTLARLGELDNTYIVFTSDNGLLLGEHRYLGKNMPYEESLRVPLLVRGPGLSAGARRSGMATLIDLAPTFLDLADARADVPVDGRSLMPLLEGTGRGIRTSLIQGGSDDLSKPWEWRGVRTHRFTYVRNTSGGPVQLFDRKLDPFELHNVARNAKYAKVRRNLHHRFVRLRSCVGGACRKASR